MQRKLTPGRLLDPQGQLNRAGYATGLVREYNRNDIKANQMRIKEWDYYLIHNDKFGIALTIADNSYMSMLSVSFLDFTTPGETTVSPIGAFSMGKTNLPSSSVSGVSSLTIGSSEFTFVVENGQRHLVCRLENFEKGKFFYADIMLTEEPEDSMVIATPFPGAPKAFYYNQKIIGMRASGTVRIGEKEYHFDPKDSFGLLDWGRGVWTYENTWYWGAGQGEVDGHVVGFNIGYGFGDTTAASENMIFVDGVAHKLEEVTFQIPKSVTGKDDFLRPWKFTSSDGRFEMDFEPILNRKSCTDLKLIISDQNQVFGYFTGSMILDNGEVIKLERFLGFAEKVRNRW